MPSFFSKPQAVAVCSCLQNGVRVYIGRVKASVVAFWGVISSFVIPARTRICSNMYFSPQSTCVCVCVCDCGPFVHLCCICLWMCGLSQDGCWLQSELCLEGRGPAVGTAASWSISLARRGRETRLITVTPITLQSHSCQRWRRHGLR